MFSFFVKKLTSLISTVSNAWSSQSREQVSAELRKILLDSDIPLKMVEEFCSKVLEKFETKLKQLPKSNKQELLQASIYQELLEFLGPDKALSDAFPKSGVALFLGLQGAGKTTSIAKVGYWLDQNSFAEKNHIYCTSTDFDRPAAIEQLKIMAEKAGINFIPTVVGDAAKTIENALKVYRENSGKFLLLDSAGRLNVDAPLMEELKKIVELARPNFKILVIDSMTGQKSLEVAQDFDQAVGVDSTILTKMDSDSRAGAALSLRWATKKAVGFMATGEKVEDLEVFIASRCASRIVGSGDVATLTEKIESQIKRAGQEADFNSMSARMMSGKITLQDFLQQIQFMSSLGSVSKIMSYLPGAGALSSTQVQQGEKMVAVYKSLIESMTLKERQMPEILGHSRKKRICAGAGRKIADLEGLLEKFEESKRFAKILSSFKR